MSLVERLPIVKFSSMLRSGGDSTSQRVRRSLVRALYEKPQNLVFGSCAGIAAASAVAFTAQTPIMVASTSALIAIALARVVIAFRMVGRTQDASTFRLERIFEIGAFSYSLALGGVAALTILFDTAAEMRVMMVATALCYGLGSAARNSGRPNIAFGQVVLLWLPIMGAALYVATPGMLALAAMMLMLIPAIASITLHLYGIVRDSIATAEKSAALAERMQQLARTDVVTGLANRAGLNHAMVETMTAMKDASQFALIWADLDRFKEVNDVLGHPVGDMVLAETGRRLRDVCGEEALVSRFGGDEFIVFIEVEDRKHAERLSSEILTEIMRPMRIDGQRLDVRSSLGVAIMPEDGADVDTVMQNADQALYHAKVAGTAQTRFFDRTMTRDLVRRREIENEMRLALQRDELSIFFQPIVDLETGRIRTFEALVRWFHPEKGELKPDEFIPVAEETGLILTLGNWITAEAARAASHWPEDVTVAVNLSPLQIRAPGAALGIMSALRKAGLDPRRLELEVTESLFIEDSQATGAFIEDLSALGVRFALDDFGTGYSSLGYINQYPFDKIKVDRSFVSGKNVGRKSEAIIRAVVEMGSQLGMKIVAEGLETAEQVNAVKNAGCTLGQGYYFSRAVPDYLAAMLLAQERDDDMHRNWRKSA